MIEAVALIKKFDPKLSLGMKSRALIKKTLPDSTETVKWSNPAYTLNNEIVVMICEYKDYLNLEFFKGAKLKSGLLQGTGKGLRHIRVRSAEDLKEKEIVKILKTAAKLTK